MCILLVGYFVRKEMAGSYLKLSSQPWRWSTVLFCSSSWAAHLRWTLHTVPWQSQHSVAIDRPSTCWLVRAPVRDRRSKLRVWVLSGWMDGNCWLRVIMFHFIFFSVWNFPTGNFILTFIICLHCAFCHTWRNMGSLNLLARERNSFCVTHWLWMPIDEM